MIIQSSNKPIVITLDTDISTASSVEVSLYDRKGEMQHWDKSKLEVAADTIILTVTQAETSEYRPGDATMSVKCMLSGETEFFDEFQVRIRHWQDKTIMEVTE